MMAQTVHLSPAQKREELLSKLKELSILESVLTSTELYFSIVEHIASTIENDNTKHYGSVIQKDLAAWERANFKLTNIVKREIVRVIHSVGVTQVSASASRKSSHSGSGCDNMIASNSSVEGGMSAHADPDDADEEEISPYPMFEGTFSELCEVIQNDNGEEGDDVDEEGDNNIDNNKDIC
jgi:ribosomal protein L9